MAEGGSETRSRPEEVIALSLPQFPQVVAEGRVDYSYPIPSNESGSCHFHNK